MSDAKKRPTDMVAVIKAIHAQREVTVPLGDGKSVTIRRPPEGELWTLAGRIDLEHVCRYTVAWSGFHERDVIDGGAEDELDFHADIFREVVVDRIDWVAKIADAIAKAVEAHSAKRKAAAGNSSPTSSAPTA